MVIAVKINAKTGKVENFINNLMTKIPKESGEAGFDMARKTETYLKFEVVDQNLIWRGKLWQGIQARRRSRNISEVFVPIRGIWLDRMQPHFVQLKRGRMIRRWAMEKGSKGIRKIAQRQGVIWVKPHPWIDEPMARAEASFPQILNQRINKAMRESG